MYLKLTFNVNFEQMKFVTVFIDKYFSAGQV